MNVNVRFSRLFFCVPSWFLTSHVAEYAKKGLRVLCIAQREISKDVLESWRPQYDAALLSMDDAEISRLTAVLETELTLIGCVGVEDKLAEDVPATIERLKVAQIRIVMLTGDKLETAINIGLQTRIFPDNVLLRRLDNPKTIIREYGDICLEISAPVFL